MSGHTKEQIEHMVSRFLSWTLPADFAPDGGISYSPQMHPPSGTNLLCYPQARAMVLHMLTGLPEGGPEWEGELTAEETAKIDAAWEVHKVASLNPSAVSALVEAAEQSEAALHEAASRLRSAGYPGVSDVMREKARNLRAALTAIREPQHD